MNGSPPSILIAGASGRLGRSVLDRSGSNGVAAKRADTADGRLRAIGLAGAAPQSAFAGIHAVINCAGISRGSPYELEEANAAFPARLAEAARAAGVPQFIHVSSLSVFGRVTRIGKASPLQPDSQYGVSKLRAEHRLLELADDRFVVTILRLPFIFSAKNPGLLRPLILAMCRLGLAPTRSGGRLIERSMITYDDAAALLVGLIGQRESATLTAADPKPLTIQRLAELVGERWHRQIVALSVPKSFAGLITLISSRIGNSLLRSSVVDPSFNYLGDERGVPVEIEVVDYIERAAPSLRA